MDACTAYLSPDGTVSASSRTWEAYSDAHSGRSCACVVGPDYLAAGEVAAGAGWTHAGKALAGLRSVLEGARERFALEYPCHAAGERRWHAFEASASADGGALVSHADITSEREATGALAGRAGRDPLTGLPNRGAFLAHLGDVLAGPAPMVAVAFLDVDGYHLVADGIGRTAADQLLLRVTERLTCQLGPDRLLARVGEDEFAMLLPAADRDGAAAAAGALLDELASPIALDGRELRVTLSAGVALAAPGSDPERLLADAHFATFRARELGPGRAEIFDAALRDASLASAQLEAELRHAIDAGQLRLHYQPKVTMDGGVVAAEALVRWEHPVRGLVSPAEFIPLAEATGLIVGLGTWALNEACRQAAVWRAEGHEIAVAVNVSPLQIREPGFVHLVAEALREAELPASALCLEITETVLVDARHDAIPTLLTLKALGVELALDDFGTGFSSLAALRGLPVDVLKIDRAFVGRLAADAADRAVVAAIIGLAHTLGRSVVAEGIETAECAAALAELGCDIGQGYHFGRPVAAAEFPLPTRLALAV